MKLRVGEASSRFTPDLDVSRLASVTLDDYLDELADRLATGWGGFTGTVEQLEAPSRLAAGGLRDASIPSPARIQGSALAHSAVRAQPR
ncbi:MAG: hypothetical protein ABSD78_19505 [Acidimicrobiales bacterium]|jgi:hypothetical protein